MRTEVVVFPFVLSHLPIFRFRGVYRHQASALLHRRTFCVLHRFPPTDSGGLFNLLPVIPTRPWSFLRRQRGLRLLRFLYVVCPPSETCLSRGIGKVPSIPPLPRVRSFRQGPAVPSVLLCLSILRVSCLRGCRGRVPLAVLPT